MWDAVYPMLMGAGGFLVKAGLVETTKQKLLWLGAALLAAIVGLITGKLIRRYKNNRRRRRARLVGHGQVPANPSLRFLFSYEANTTLPGENRRFEAIGLADDIDHSDFSWGVLKGPVGSGKTSLIRAGVIPIVEKRGRSVVYLASPRELLVELRTAPRAEFDLLTAFEQKVVELSTRAGSDKIVLVIDQFEELLAEFQTIDTRSKIGRFLSNPLRFARVQVLCCIRDDYAGQLHDLSPGIPEPLATKTTRTLRNFSIDEAIDVIRECAGSDLVIAQMAPIIARDLARTGSVRPPELQIVLREIRNRRLDAGGFKAIGGGEGILADFLETTIKENCAVPAFARQLLRAFAVFDKPTPERIQRNLAELATILTISPQDRERNQMLNETMAVFLGTIITPVGGGFNLAHDYLLEPVRLATTSLSTMTEEANRQLLALNAPDVFNRQHSISPRARTFITRNATPKFLREPANAMALRRATARFWFRVISWSCVIVLAVTSANTIHNAKIDWHPLLLAKARSASGASGYFMPSVRRGPDASVWVIGERVANLWNTNDATVRYTHKEGPAGRYQTVSVSPSGRLLLVADSERLAITDVADAKRVRVIPLGTLSYDLGTTNGSPGVTANLGSTRVMPALPSGETAIFDSTEHFVLTYFPQPAIPGEVVLCGMRLYSVDQERLIASISNVPLMGPRETIFVLSDGSGAIIPVGNSRGQASALWKLDASGSRLIPLAWEESARPIAVAMDDIQDRAIVLDHGLGGQSIAMWDLKKGTVGRVRNVSTVPRYQSVRFAGRGKYVLLFGISPDISDWSSREDARIDVLLSDNFLPPGESRTDLRVVYVDGDSAPDIVSWQTETGLVLWNMTSDFRSTLPGDFRDTSWFQASRDGRLLLALSRNKRDLAIWDLDKRRQTASIKLDAGARLATFAPDETAVVLIDNDSRITLYKPNGTFVGTFLNGIYTYDARCNRVHGWTFDGDVVEYSYSISVPLLGVWRLDRCAFLLTAGVAVSGVDD